MAQCEIRRFGLFDAGRELSATISDTAVSFWLKERSLAHATGGGLELTPHESDGSWDLAFDNADATARLRFVPVTAPYAWTLAQGLEHREWAGSVTGTLEVRGESFEIDAAGYHELETGPALASIAEHAFTARSFLDAGTWAYATIVTVGRRDHLFGCLHRGESQELRSAEIAVAYAHPGGPPLVGTVDLEDATGRRLEQTFARGAAVATVDATDAGFISRNVAFPAFAGPIGAGVGQVDYWFTDPVLARPHLYAINLTEALA